MLHMLHFSFEMVGITKKIKNCFGKKGKIKSCKNGNLKLNSFLNSIYSCIIFLHGEKIMNFSFLSLFLDNS